MPEKPDDTDCPARESAPSQAREKVGQRENQEHDNIESNRAAL